MYLGLSENVEKSNKALAKLVFEIICLCGEKLKNPNTQKGPNFMVSFLLDDSGIKEGFYIPILHSWGMGEYAHLMWECGGFVLPFPHEDMWQLLLDRECEETPTELLVSEVGEWKTIVGGIRPGLLFLPNSKQCKNFPLYYGGTRQGRKILQKIIQSPWSPSDLDHDSATCPFCDESRKGMAFGGIAPGIQLKVLDAAFTPFSWHKLIVPTKEFVQHHGISQSLYGADFLEAIFDVACFYACSPPQKSLPLLLGSHIGWLAGQNVAHLHFHLYQYIQ